MQAQSTAAFYREGCREIFTETPLTINWQLTRMCNYACSYCFGQSKLNKKNFSTWSHLQQAVQNIANLNRSQYRICLVGGEPTAHPHFSELLNECVDVLQDKLSMITIVSNGSHNIKLYQNIAKISRNIPIYIDISIHSEFAQLKHIKELITQTAHTAHLNFKCMFNYKKLDYIKEVCQELIGLRQDYPFTFTITKLRIPPEFTLFDPAYTEEHFALERDILKQFNNAAKQSKHHKTFTKTFAATIFYEHMNNDCIEVIKHPGPNQQLEHGFRNFKNMYCAMGTSLIRIDPNGRCNGSVCWIASKNTKNIFDSNFFFDDNFVRLIKCTYKNCGCISDLCIPKFADEVQGSHFLEDFKTRTRLRLHKKSKHESLLTSMQNSLKSMILRRQIRKIL